MKFKSILILGLSLCTPFAMANLSDQDMTILDQTKVERLLNSSKIGEKIRSKVRQKKNSRNYKDSELLDVYVVLNTSQMKGDRRTKIAGVQNKLLNSLSHRGKKFKGLTRYKHIPVIRAQLSISQIDTLSLSTDVNLIHEKQLMRKLDAEGHQLAAVDLAQSAGYTGNGVTVAIIDDGIDYSHAAFGGSNNFPNGKIVGGYDFADNDSNPGNDCAAQSHGTAVTGVAVGNGGGVNGVAPNAKAVMLKVQSQGAGCNPGDPDYGFLDGDLIGAIDWAIDNKDQYGIGIISMSLGHNRAASRGWGDASSCGSDNQVDYLAVEAANNAGITVLAASGNDGFCSEMSSPACLSNVVSVGAVYDADLDYIGWEVASTSCADITRDNRSSTGWLGWENAYTGNVTVYSNSADYLDITAPSTCAETAKAGGGVEDCFGGTSSATPFAAGVAALAIEAAGSSLSPAELKDALVTSGDPGVDPKNGITKPRVNAYNLVTSVSCTPGVDCPEPPCTPGVDCPEPPCTEGVDCPEPPCTEGVDCPEAITYTNEQDVRIRNRRTSTSSITVSESGQTNDFTVAVDIKHTYVGDLRITIYAPDGSYTVLKDTNSSDSSVNLLQSYNITPTNSVGMAGDWRLEVYDAYRGDTGKIDSWSITFN